MNKWLLIISFFAFISGFAQEDDLYDHGLDQNKWQDIREGIRYEGQKEGPGRQWTYESQEEYERERKRYESGDGSGSGSGGGGTGSGSRPGDGSSERPSQYTPPPPPPDVDVDMPNFSGLGVIGYILIGVFFVGLIVLIFYLFLSGERKGAKVTGEQINFEEVNPTEIPLTELQRLLQEALSKGDYRGAIRIYFIFIIRDLAEKNWIKWEKEKTNFHYLREMSGKNEFHDFNVSVSYFEIIWYGKREIDATKFEEVKPKFTRLLDKLGVK